MKKSTNTVDKEIGSRVRMRRMLIGMSQEKLGEMLDLTFQQVQKYEKGTNRISVSRLLDIAQVLGVNIQFFYEGLSGGARNAEGFADDGSPAYLMNFMQTPEGLQLMRAFAKIKSPKLRRGIVQFVTTIGVSEDDLERSS